MQVLARLILAVLMTAVMVFMVTLIVTFINLGLRADFLAQWAKAYFIANQIPITFEGRKGAGCNTSINFLDPDGFEFEIYCEMDQVGPDNRLRPASLYRPADPLEEAIANPVVKDW